MTEYYKSSRKILSRIFRELHVALSPGVIPSAIPRSLRFPHVCLIYLANLSRKTHKTIVLLRALEERPFVD